MKLRVAKNYFIGFFCCQDSYFLVFSKTFYDGCLSCVAIFKKNDFYVQYNMHFHYTYCLSSLMILVVEIHYPMKLLLTFMYSNLKYFLSVFMEESIYATWIEIRDTQSNTELKGFYKIKGFWGYEPKWTKYEQNMT